ncbi:hypothetical protein [Chryseobacterium sp. IT-36CA2]|uniref:hypothetical protein n=1 Tax=Chryseobacterium sp. IT-36CA2 TaxID=3026460 RepID=UPI0039E0C3E9
MKTTTKNQYASEKNTLIFFSSMLLGYNLYQEIYHPEKADLTLCLIIIALTTFTVQKYRTKMGE